MYPVLLQRKQYIRERGEKDKEKVLYLKKRIKGLCVYMKIKQRGGFAELSTICPTKTDLLVLSNC